MNRRDTLLALLAIGASPVTASGQQAGNAIRRIGVLISSSSTNAGSWVDVFRRRLNDLGWVEGRNVIVDVRYGNADSKLYDGLAAELMAKKPDLIFAPATLTALAVRRISADIPIVFAVALDPIGSGLAASWAHPGGNSTGLSTTGADMSAKRLHLLQECVSKLARVAVLREPSPSLNPAVLDMVLNAGKQLGISMSVVDVSNEAEIDSAFRKIRRERMDGIITLDGSPLFVTTRQLVVARAAAIRVPAIYTEGSFVEDGGLMSYGADYTDQFRRAANYVDKILKGAKPSDLPVEQPMKFELIVNLKAAKALGIAFPQSILVRADKVIE